MINKTRYVWTNVCPWVHMKNLWHSVIFSFCGSGSCNNERTPYGLDVASRMAYATLRDSDRHVHPCSLMKAINIVMRNPLLIPLWSDGKEQLLTMTWSHTAVGLSLAHTFRAKNCESDWLTMSFNLFSFHLFFSDCTDREQMLTLLSELKILIHIGQHLNIVNLLGAVTKNIARGTVKSLY